MTSSRKHCLSGDSCAPDTPDEALYCQLHHSARSLPEIARIVGKRQGYLMDVGNPDREDHRLPSDLIVPLRWAAESTVYIERLATECGGLFVEQPRVTADARDVIERAADVMGACGRTLAEAHDALLDGSINAHEATRICANVDAAMTALAALRLLVPMKAGVR